MFFSRFMPCEQCGESLDMTYPAPHQCAPDRLADFQMFALREDVAAFPDSLRDYLESPHGRFEVWAAARHVRQTR